MRVWSRSFPSLAAALSVAVTAAVGVTLLPEPGERFACGDTALSERQIASRFKVGLATLQRVRDGGVSYEELCSMAPQHRAKTLRKADHPKTDQPGEALEWRNMTLRSEDGTIAEDGLLLAREQLDRLIATQGTVDGGGISTGSWTSIGPGNIGGRVRTLIINPSAPTTVLLGSVGGGIWRSTDGGASWAPVQDFMANLAVSTIVAQPNDFNVQYAGTGEGFWNADGIRGLGIFKSTDGGLTWSQLASTNNANFHYVNRVAISPDSSIVLAATRTGLYRSTDAGVTWTLVQAAPTYGITDVDFHPTNSSLAVASGHAGSAWYSVNGGASWTAATGMPSCSTFCRVEITYSKSSPTTVYTSTDTSGGLLYRSTDGGATYSYVFGNPVSGDINYLGSQGWYDNTLWVNPVNPSMIIVGGIDLYRSTDAGASFTKISAWQNWPASAHADHHYVIEVPGFNNSTVAAAYFVNDGGVYYTANVNTVGNNPTVYTFGWQELNNQLGITQFYGAGADAGTGKVMGGTQDNGTLTYTTATGSEGWVFEFGGDGGYSAIDQTNANYCYGEYVYLRIHRSTTGCGANSGNWIYTSGLTDAINGFANFIAPFILDPNDQARLLGGGRSLWRTQDARAATVAWAAIKPPTTGSSNISAIAVQELDSNHVWVGHNNGDLYKTTNGLAATPTWTLMDTGLPNKMVTRVAIDRSNPLIVYVTFGGYESNNIWKSTNGGTSWTNLHGTLPAAPIRSIVLNPTNQSWLYLGTEVGVFTSENGGSTWFLPHDGPSNVSVDELFFSGSFLYAATHGRGIYRATLDTTVPGAATLISPNTYIGTTSPTYRWNSVATSTWYYLSVTDATGTVRNTWFTATAAGCPSGGVCQVTPGVALAAGAASWRIQTWSPVGYGEWSTPMPFHTGYPTTEVFETWPVPDTQAGNVAPLWIRVRNTGTLALPTGSQAWVYVTGPGGFGAWAGYGDITGLAAGATRWVLVNWTVPISRTPGVHSYYGRVWWSTSSAYVSPPSATRNFNVAAPAVAAQIVSTYQVDGALPGGTARLWALVRNTGTSPLTGRVWMNLWTVGWIGYAEIVNLAPGAQQWYYYDWAIPANRPTGTHWYYAQVWNTAGNVAYSAASPWQAFLVGFTSSFTTGFDGWTAVAGPWSHTSGSYLYTPSAANLLATVQYPLATYTNVDFSARVWRNTADDWYSGVYVRGTPGTTDAGFWANGYVFLFDRAGFFTVIRYVNGAWTVIQNWTFTAAIVQGSAWNIARVRANGSSLQLYFNNTLVWSGTDTTHTTGQVGVGGYRSAADTGFGFWVDSATVTGYGAPADNHGLVPAHANETISAEQRRLNEEANREPGAVMSGTGDIPRRRE